MEVEIACFDYPVLQILGGNARPVETEPTPLYYETVAHIGVDVLKLAEKDNA